MEIAPFSPINIFPTPISCDFCAQSALLAPPMASTAPPASESATAFFKASCAFLASLKEVVSSTP